MSGIRFKRFRGVIENSQRARPDTIERTCADSGFRDDAGRNHEWKVVKYPEHGKSFCGSPTLSARSPRHITETTPPHFPTFSVPWPCPSSECPWNGVRRGSDPLERGPAQARLRRKRTQEYRPPEARAASASASEPGSGTDALVTSIPITKPLIAFAFIPPSPMK